jgi:hypothetical protein
MERVSRMKSEKSEPVWGKPLGAVKAHVFFKGKTLCGSVLFGRVPEKSQVYSPKLQCHICREGLEYLEAHLEM